MAIKATTAWVRPPDQIRGQDHLGTRVPCEILYGCLIPGITNVTDRVRYYSFYPWLLWAIYQRNQDLDDDAVIERLRRADCLFTLIGANHGADHDDEERHGGSLVGRRVLVDVLEELRNGRTRRLSGFTSSDSQQRYFKNRLGGLGQYYLGSLSGLGVLDVGPRGIPRFTTQRGKVIAEAFDMGVERHDFLNAIQKDAITIGTLADLQSFCPCHLSSNKAERQMLIDLFFNGSDTFHDDKSNSRCSTLTLMLDLIDGLSQLNEAKQQGRGEIDLFRAAAYSGALLNGKKWSIPATLEDIRAGWHLYQRNELLSIAIQGIFWAALAELDSRGGVVANREAFRDAVVSSTSGDALGARLKMRFGEAVDRARLALPMLSDWADERHEIQLGLQLYHSTSDPTDAKSRSRVVGLALDILLALSARSNWGDDPYGGYLDREQVQPYPINLFTLRAHAQETWPRMTLRDLLAWLISEWVLETHFRIALRKLRAESKDTLRIIPTDDGLEVVDVVRPEFTNPRLRQAFRILYDLGALERRRPDRLLTLTSLGRRLLEEHRG